MQKFLTVFTGIMICLNSLIADVILYSSKRCPYCKDVENYLSSVHKTVKTYCIDDQAELKAELKAKGGKVQVPCLIVDDYPLYGSQDIIKWMKTHPERLQDESERKK